MWWNKKFGIRFQFVWDRKIWNPLLVYLWRKNLESGSSLYVTKKFGIRFQFVCDKKIWNRVLVCLWQKNLESASSLFVTKKFGIVCQMSCALPRAGLRLALSSAGWIWRKVFSRAEQLHVSLSTNLLFLKSVCMPAF